MSGLGQSTLSFHFLAGGRAVQRLDFAGGEFAKGARFNIELQGAVGDAADLLDVVADLFEHLAQLGGCGLR